jgi:hypothetical protein
VARAPFLGPVVVAVVAIVVSAHSTARADIPTVAAAAPPSEPDAVVEKGPPARSIDRTWLYADDGRVAAPLTLIGTTSTSYTDVGSSPFRVASTVLPTKYRVFGANTAEPGAALAVGGELGLFPRVSVMALGQVGVGGVNGASGGAVAGLRVQLSPASWSHVHVAASGGYLRQAWDGPHFNEDAGTWLPGSPGGANGAWVQAAVSADVGRVRFVGNVHGEHVFASGRDPLDMMVDLGATVRVVGRLRAGAELVGQDLEEVFTRAAEGGARMFVGPIASMQLLDDRLSLVAGPAIGVSQVTGEAPSFVGRVAASYGF